jgi:hypothetical protein
MKRVNDFFEKYGGGLLFAVMLLCSLFVPASAGALTADVIVEPGGGVAEHGDDPASVDFANANVEDLILHTIDREVLKLEPYRFPLDTISRQIKRVRNSNNQIVDYYTDGYVPSQTKLKTAVTTAGAQLALDFFDNANIAVNETLILSVKGYLPGTTTVDPLRNLVLVVVDRDASGKPICQAINGSGAANNIPALAANTGATRAGRAASEMQIRTDIFTSMPTKETQYLQKFIAEIEESTFFDKADKEVKWNMNDITERALLEYRREVNNSYWKGVKRLLKTKNKYNRKLEDTYYTEGLWYLAGGDFSFGGVAPTAQTLVDLMRAAFDGPSSSDTKMLLASSDFMTAMEKVQYNQVIYPGERKQLFGFNLSSVISKFGELLVFHDKSLNEVGLGGYAFVLDPNYLTKWTMGWRSIPVDNVANGDADSKSRILTEACGLTLKNRDAHLRVSLA